MTPGLHNFADWLPPMLVKELRQGLQTRMFVGLFGVIQVLMITILGFRLMSISVQSSDEMLLVLDNGLWLSMELVLVVLLPLRALSAISSERGTNTLELVQLTTLGTTGIVLGKWVALVSQTLLVVVTLLPYLLLRYFFGGIDIATNIAVLGWMTLLSVVLTTLCLAISPTNVWTKLVVLAATAFVVGVPTYALIDGGIETFLGSGGPSAWVFWLPLVLAIPFLLLIALKRVANEAETFSWLLRLMTLLVCIVMGFVILKVKGTTLDATVVTFGTLIVWGCAEMMTESAHTNAIVYRSWVRRGWWARMAGRLLYQGWGPGMLVILVGVLVASGLLLWKAGIAGPVSTKWSAPASEWFSKGPRIAFVIVQAGFALLMPRVFIELLPSIKQRLWVYAVGIMFAVLNLSLVNMIWHRADHPVRQALAMATSPLSSSLWILNNTGYYPAPTFPLHMKVAAGVDAALLAYLLVRSRKEFRVILAAESTSLDPSLS